MSSSYELIETEKANYPIIGMCDWLGVSRSGFYQWRDRPPSATADRRAALTDQIVKVFDEFKQRYGYRKIRATLKRRGVQVSEWLVRSIMAAEGLVCCHPRPFRVTTDNDGSTGPVDLLQRDFTATGPGEVFVGDITYVPTWQGWVYLATMIDVFTREVVGYSTADHMRTPLITDAVAMAVRSGRVNNDAVFHSDRGSQYTSIEFAAFLARNNMRGSMGRTGVCWDNAMAESFFATLKKELVHRTVFPTRRSAEHEISTYIELFYNRCRIHSNLGYNTPTETREMWESNQQAA